MGVPFNNSSQRLLAHGVADEYITLGKVATVSTTLPRISMRPFTLG